MLPLAHFVLRVPVTVGSADSEQFRTFIVKFLSSIQWVEKPIAAVPMDICELCLGRYFWGRSGVVQKTVTCAATWQAEARVADWKRGFLQPRPETCAGITLTCASACQAEAQVSVTPAQVSGRGCKNLRSQSATRASACQVEAQVTVFWTDSFFDQGWPGTINGRYTNPIIPIPTGIR